MTRTITTTERTDGYSRRWYSATNPKTGVVGVYSVDIRPNGEEFAASRDRHEPADYDPHWHGTPNESCPFLDGRPCKCDGGTAGVYPTEAERWAEAESMAYCG